MSSLHQLFCIKYLLIDEKVVYNKKSKFHLIGKCGRIKMITLSSQIMVNFNFLFITNCLGNFTVRIQFTIFFFFSPAPPPKKNKSKKQLEQTKDQLSYPGNWCYLINIFWCSSVVTNSLRCYDILPKLCLQSQWSESIIHAIGRSFRNMKHETVIFSNIYST